MDFHLICGGGNWPPKPPRKFIVISGHGINLPT